MKWIALLIIFIEAGLALMPYSFGYGDERVSLAWFLQNGWKQDEWQHCWLILPCFCFLLMSAPGNTANSLFIPLIIFMQFAETIEITVYTLRPGLCQPTLAIIGLWLS